MDIQPCGSNESIAYYIAKYMSKSEPVELDPGIGRAIQLIRREKCNISCRLFKICMRIMKERQVSACECVYRLRHLNLQESSRNCVFLDTRKPEQRYKVLKLDESGRANGYHSNIFEKDERRPTEHPGNSVNLLEFAMRFRTTTPRGTIVVKKILIKTPSKQKHRKKGRVITLTDNTKMSVRNALAVVRSAADNENCFYSLICQYKPFRNETELSENYITARDALLANWKMHSIRCMPYKY
ncbi:hypothetical protein AVEN_59459-1 [Araneus ventricosus]|uniref:Uncharacterized protein n=1 Tax=Araneus ventricosus TaxID=182803 RepID=A0A4Y2N708_ARAVE|nr:hypothetical protein AVEN_59459-1 [Araneus ventricosus]